MSFHRLLLAACLVVCLCVVSAVGADDVDSLRRLPDPTIDVLIDSVPRGIDEIDLMAEDWTPLEESVPSKIDGWVQKAADWEMGSVKIKPYGTFWTDAIYATDRTNPGAFTLYVFSEEDQGESTFTIDARRSRFGLDANGPAIPELNVSESHGRVEIDFFGSFVTENFANVLLRHAYWEIQNDNYRFLIGQYWDVISPLIPGSINYGAQWMGGNIGFRRAQVRYERFAKLLPSHRSIVQFSVNQDIIPDFVTLPGVRTESASWPVLQGRVAWEATGDIPWHLGASAHIGETGFDFLVPGPPPLDLPPADDQRFQTWSFNVDWSMQLAERLKVQGEFFTGANLSQFLGGIGQGVCPCLRVPIRSTGGWFDVRYQLTDDIRLTTGFSLDDPRDADSLIGRVYNHSIFGNVVFNLTEHLQTGFEVAIWKTLYQETRVGQIPDSLLTPSAPGNSTVLQWMVNFSF